MPAAGKPTHPRAQAGPPARLRCWRRISTSA
jgi:hypothetical protein